MESWFVGMICNGIIAVAYLLICLAIVVPLWRSNQLRSNPLGAATASIFFSCAVHHGIHSVHMLLPTFGLDDEKGLAMRAAWDWPLSLWDVVGAVIGVYYWTLRRNYSSLMEGAQLFQDLRQREQQALELNDTVLQGLVVAKMALDLDDTKRAQESLTASIDSASRIITDLLGSSYHSLDLVRSAPAAVVGDDAPKHVPPPGAAAPTPDTSAGDGVSERPRT
jgi:signal transduction histidine kinase